MGDIGGLYGTHQMGNHTVTIAKKGSNMDLDMMDFITLMITQMTNQGIDDTMDTSEMINQMVQMQMIQSMVNMTDATMMNYTASLVGKEVTVGKWTADGLQEISGIVEATGTMDGQPVIFVNGEYYYLSEIMAVGKLPPPKENEEDGKVDGSEGTEGTEKPTDPDGAEGADKPKDPDETEETDPAEGSDKVDGSGSVESTDQAQTPENDGSSGTPNDIED